jgi:hypothetical protein
MIVLAISIGGKPMQCIKAMHNYNPIMFMFGSNHSIFIFLIYFGLLHEISIQHSTTQTLQLQFPSLAFSWNHIFHNIVTVHPKIFDKWQNNSFRDLNRLHSHDFARFAPIIHPWCPKEKVNPLEVFMQIDIHFLQHPSFYNPKDYLGILQIYWTWKRKCHHKLALSNPLMIIIISTWTFIVKHLKNLVMHYILIFHVEWRFL